MKTKSHFIILLLLVLTACKKDKFVKIEVFAWGDSLTAGLSRKYSYTVYLQQLAQIGIENKA